ncbi:hypothetical protein ACFYO2_05235 [Streptomyces sp. NPDC006602]|uniref:hypothetical protein n=1 Tax=Streptomyces sp. NPDC006602 TaxID=3364751 RepID=UPI0036934BDD
MGVIEGQLPGHLVGVEEVVALQDQTGQAAALQAGGVHQLVGELAQVVLMGGRGRRAAGPVPAAAVVFFAAVFMAGCFFAVFFFGSSWTSASSPREALACWPDSVRAAMRSRTLPGCSGSGAGAVEAKVFAETHVARWRRGCWSPWWWR